MKTNVVKIGTVTLLQPYRFTQYSEHAAWTDYVSCEPQTVELRLIDNYWVCAKFNGTLTETSFPSGARNVGQPAEAAIQRNRHGFDIESDLFKFELDSNVQLKAMGKYGEGCGKNSGQDILFLEFI